MEKVLSFVRDERERLIQLAVTCSLLLLIYMSHFLLPSIDSLLDIIEHRHKKRSRGWCWVLLNCLLTSFPSSFVSVIFPILLPFIECLLLSNCNPLSYPMWNLPLSITPILDIYQYYWQIYQCYLQIYHC